MEAWRVVRHGREKQQGKEIWELKCGSHWKHGESVQNALHWIGIESYWAEKDRGSLLALRTTETARVMITYLQSLLSRAKRLATPKLTLGTRLATCSHTHTLYSCAATVRSGRIRHEDLGVQNRWMAQVYATRTPCRPCQVHKCSIPPTSSSSCLYQWPGPSAITLSFPTEPPQSRLVCS